MAIENVQLTETPQIIVKTAVQQQQQIKQDVKIEALKVSDRNKETDKADTKDAIRNREAKEDESQKTGLQESVKIANALMEAINNKLVFVVDKRLEDQLVVKVIDNETERVIKQYPPEEMLDLIARLKETILGILLDKKT